MTLWRCLIPAGRTSRHAQPSSHLSSTRMDEHVVEKEEGADLLLASAVELAEVARFEETATGSEEGGVEVGEGALEVEDLEVGGVGMDLGVEVGGDCERKRSAFRP